MKPEIKELRKVTVNDGKKIIFTIKYAEAVGKNGKPCLMGCAGSIKVESHKEAA